MSFILFDLSQRAKTQIVTTLSFTDNLMSCFQKIKIKYFNLLFYNMK